MCVPPLCVLMRIDQIMSEGPTTREHEKEFSQTAKNNWFSLDTRNIYVLTNQTEKKDITSRYVTVTTVRVVCREKTMLSWMNQPSIQSLSPLFHFFLLNNKAIYNAKNRFQMFTAHLYICIKKLYKQMVTITLCYNNNKSNNIPASHCLVMIINK